MAELLLELLSEDIPARMQAWAAQDLKRLVCGGLKEAGLSFEKAEAFVTPRRLALVVDGLPEQASPSQEVRKGPRVDSPHKAIEGFLRSVARPSVDHEDIRIRKTEKGEFYFFEALIAPKDTSRELPSLLQDAIGALPWPKSMRWKEKQIHTWVRPLHRILAIFDGNKLDLDYNLIHTPEVAANPTEADIIVAGNVTVGHRFLAPKPFKVKDFADYKAKLGKARVMLDQKERREAIWKKATELAKAEGLTVKEDEALVAENAGLVEWPVVLMGKIDAAFMDLPPEVLTTVMRQNQKYFSLLKKDGALAPRFIVVADTAPDDGGKAIVAGNERVLRARLADARFFWDQDRKRTLESRLPALEDIIFHEKLGKMAGKVERMQALAAEIGARIPGCDPEQARRAAQLCKADLTTQMVAEFPELQGVMGRYYVLEDGEREDVADAIAEHYSPIGPNDKCPRAPVSVAVALADKIDTLVGFFAVGEKPTGSKDPFALRRAALGVIRLIVENSLRIPLARVFNDCFEIYDETSLRPLWIRNVSIYSPKEWVEDMEMYARRFETLRSNGIDGELLPFFADRLKVQMREKGVRHDLISAVFAVQKPEGGGEDDLVRLMARVDALEAFLRSDDGANLLIAYRRAANIVGIEEKKDGVKYDAAAAAALFTQPEERDLDDWLARVRAQSDEVLKQERFDDAMKILAGLRKPVDVFFDEVTVNCKEAELRENRLKLLSQIRTTMNTIADFSRIEGESRR